MLVGRVHKGAELVDWRVKGVLKRLLVVDNPRVAPQNKSYFFFKYSTNLATALAL